jgi:hypothetical protein
MTRCNNCNKKLNIINFSCDCDYKNLCTNCRYPENHKCTYDFKTNERKKLEINNPKVIGDKFEKI